jgi:hypothetical protein
MGRRGIANWYDARGMGSRSAQAIGKYSKRGERPASEIRNNQDILEIYDRGALVFETRVSALTLTSLLSSQLVHSLH